MSEVNFTEALMVLANTVEKSQDCVLEVVIGESGAVAHLIPRDLWEDMEMEGDLEGDD